MHRILTAAAGVIALLAATLAVTAAAPGAGQPPYLDAHASVKQRVNDLLHRMTLEEKVGQMDEIVIGKLRDAGMPATGAMPIRESFETSAAREGKPQARIQPARTRSVDDYTRPSARSMRRSRTRLSWRRPSCSNSFVSHMRSPLIRAAVSSENTRSTYMSSA
jgi:hypothetical protein